MAYFKNKPGYQPPACETPATQPPKYRSASQLSYDNQVDQLSKLVQLLGTDSNYAPNEPGLQAPTLASLVEKMKSANTAFIEANTNWSNMRIQRDNIMYNPETGLVQTAKEVKKYILSVFGVQSLQYQQVSAIKFTSYTGN